MALSAADKGTATHLVLEHLDFTRPCRAEDLAEQIKRMLDLKLIAPAQADSVDRGAIEWFAACEIGQQIRHSPAGDVLREIPFNLSLPPGDFPGMPDSSEGLDQVMLRGRIDLLLRHGDSVVVIDYKTDNITADQIEGRKEMYQPQVLLYRDAIQKLTGLRVGGVYLIFLTPRIVCGM
jgi:ATP-dependent helicase/nuclease subunit A